MYSVDKSAVDWSAVVGVCNLHLLVTHCILYTVYYYLGKWHSEWAVTVFGIRLIHLKLRMRFLDTKESILQTMWRRICCLWWRYTFQHSSWWSTRQTLLRVSQAISKWPFQSTTTVSSTGQHFKLVKRKAYSRKSKVSKYRMEKLNIWSDQCRPKEQSTGHHGAAATRQ